MSKVIVVLADGFEEIEAVSVIDILRRAEVETAVCSLKAGAVRSARGLLVQADGLISDIDPEKFGMIVLPGGGEGAKNIGEDAAVMGIVKKFLSEEKFVAAICAAPYVLAEKGLIKDCLATCYPSFRVEFEKYCDYQSAGVVVDEHIITASGPGAAAEFAFTLVELLKDEESAQNLRETMLFS